MVTAIALSALTGARRGELCALRWSDIDLPGARLTIARSLTVVADEAHEGPTKTHAIRLVTLDPVGVEVLMRRWSEQQRFAEEVDVPLDPDPFVLTYSPRGDTHAGPDYLSHMFSKLCKRAGLVRTVNRKRRTLYRFHDLRHFAATQLIASGTDVRTVAARLGHAQTSTTLDIYAHALPAQDVEAAAVLGRLVGPALNSARDD
jgi:integrase